MKKVIKLIALLMVFALALTSCSKSGGSSSSSTSSTTRSSSASTESVAASTATEETTDLKLGMIAQIYGTQSFNDDIRDGIDDLSEKYGIENICLEVPNIADAGNSLRTLIMQGVDFIIIGSPEYADAMVDAAIQYPEVKFLYLTEAEGMPENVMTTEYAEQEGAFLIGALAGLLTQSNNVGSVAAIQGDIVQERFTWGFKAGAEYVNENVVVQSAYTNSYTDINKGQEVANAMYSRGADIVSTFAGACNLGVFNAANSAGDGKYCFGAAKGQFDQMPNKIVASLVKPVDQTIVAIVSDYIETGIFNTSQPTSLGLGNDGVIVRYTNLNDDLLALITPEIQATLDEISAAIISGDIVPPQLEADYIANWAK